jgi:hypothetical protein
VSSMARWISISAHGAAYDGISDTIERAVGDHQSGDRPPLEVAKIVTSLSAGRLDRACHLSEASRGVNLGESANQTWDGHDGGSVCLSVSNCRLIAEETKKVDRSKSNGQISRFVRRKRRLQDPRSAIGDAKIEKRRHHQRVGDL